MTDKRESWGATTRNADPILAVLQRVLPAEGTVLEIASGTGQHAAHFTAGLPGLTWQPTDLNRDHFESIEAWRAHVGTDRLLPSIQLDVTTDDWPVAASFVAMVNINMVHISPWEACQGLLDGAARHLAPDGVLFLYGPYRVGGAFRSEGDEAFDANLRERNPAWGIRNLEDVEAAATERGLRLSETVEMPANNLSVVFRRG